MLSIKIKLMNNFEDAFAALIGNEGNYTDNPLDPGNWTGARVGLGACRGTKFGVSAARYPSVDIKALTLDQARILVKRDYWDAFRCDELDPNIGFQVLDAAYNGGHAARWLQQAAGIHPDGDIGPATVAAVKAADPLRVIARFDAYRLQYLAAIDRPTFLDGWMRRIASNILRGMS
jgi:lysozyme family protein